MVLLVVGGAGAVAAGAVHHLPALREDGGRAPVRLGSPRLPHPGPLPRPRTQAIITIYCYFIG